MAEWLKAAVLKTVVRLRVPRVRIPLSPPYGTPFPNHKTTALLSDSFGSSYFFSFHHFSTYFWGESMGFELSEDLSHDTVSEESSAAI